jgi:hypothetical protein
MNSTGTIWLEEFNDKENRKLQLGFSWIACPVEWQHFISSLDLHDNLYEHERNKLIDEALVEFHATRIPGRMLTFDTSAHKTFFLIRWSS